jgi:rhamnosyltransferase
MPECRVSVIVRTFDSAATVEATFASIRRQTVPAEIVVVDSGSTDGTLAIAERFADRVIEIPHTAFSYGGALNAGAAAANAPVHVALSSHCAFPREDWLEIAAAHILDEGATAACGLPRDGDRRPLAGPLAVDHAYAVAHQHWGFSNHASAWSAVAWRRHRFDEELTSTEDKEWTWRALAGGGALVVDPRLIVPGTHRRAGGVRAYHRRLVKEIRAIEHLRPLPAFGLVDAAADWARATPRDPFLSSARRFGRTRLVEVAARWQAGHPSRALSAAGTGAVRRDA